MDDCGDNTDEIGCESSSTTEKGGKSFNVGSDTKHQCKNKIQWNFDSSNSDDSNTMDRSNCYLVPSIFPLIPCRINPNILNISFSNRQTIFMVP